MSPPRCGNISCSGDARLELSSWDETLQDLELSLLLRCLALLSADDRNWVVRYFPPLGSILILERMQTRFVDFLKTYKCSSYVFLQEVKPVILCIRAVSRTAV